jgi:signal peptidase I
MDFALILVLATLITGVIWAIDKFSLEPARKAKLASAQEKAAGELPEQAKSELLRAPSWADTGRSMFPVLFAVLIVRSFLVEPFQIPSGSMLPTLKIGDFILVNKFHYGIRLPVTNTKVIDLSDPERGDVVVFRYPKDPSVNYIKRVVGLPGDTISYRNKRIYVNGVEQEMELIAQLPPSQPQRQLINETLGDVEHEIYRDINRPGMSGDWVVPEGHYFMMGDNRDNSNDSRYWGFVADDLLVGKAFAVWMHWPGLPNLPDFSAVRSIQ